MMPDRGFSAIGDPIDFFIQTVTILSALRMVQIRAKKYGYTAPTVAKGYGQISKRHCRTYEAP